MNCQLESVTARWSQVAGERRGKLLGVLDRLQHILEAGATTVMFTPLAASGPGA